MPGTHLMRAAFWLTVYTASFGVATTALGRLHWILELASHFLVQYLIVLIVGVAIAAFQKRRKRLAIPALALFAALWQVLPMLPRPRADPADTHSVTIAYVNLRTSNTQYPRVREFITDTAPDLFVCVEVDLVWQQELAPALKAFRYSKVLPQNNNFGLAIYSKLPASGFRVHQLGQTSVPALEATIHQDERQLRLILVHTIPPVGAWPAKQRNRQLVDLAQLAAASPTPTVVIGDLNVSPWSPYFRDLLRISNLRSGRLGRGIQPSWRTSIPLLRIPIDHCLVSKGLHVIDHTVPKQHLGSDHFPLIATVGWQP